MTIAPGRPPSSLLRTLTGMVLGFVAAVGASKLARRAREEDVSDARVREPPAPIPPDAEAQAEAQAEAAEGEAQKARLRETWRAPTGWRSLSDVNNTRVGVWYTATALAFFLFAGVLALMMRVQLAVPGNTFLSPDMYNQAMTLHGSVMMFLFAVPIFEAVAILLLPQFLASRDLPFPRLSAFGFWAFVIGGTFVCVSIFFGAAPTGGWFMYPPLTTDTRQMGIGAEVWLLGLSFIEVAAIAAAVELIVGVLKFRAPGMRINLMPLYAWYVLVVGGMIVFAFPPLIAGDLMFELERVLGWPFFNAEKGGDPVLWQHLFWIFGHPEVYIVFLPSIALIAMIVPTFARTPVFGYEFIVLAAVGTGFLSFGLWAHHMYTTGLPSISLGMFSAASEAVAIPTGVQIFCFIATLLMGRVVFSVPMLFVVGSFAIFVFGGLTGVMVAVAPFDWQAHDTYFIVAHLHYVLIGGVLFPIVAGLYYYYPLLMQKRLSDAWGKVAFWTMFVGFNTAFLPMHFTGMRGMPRRVATYPEGIGFDILNLVSTVGAVVFAAGILVIVADVLFRAKPKAGRNPWGSGTIEWLAESDGENWGVRSVPIVRHRYPIWMQKDFVADYDAGRFLLSDAPEGKRETIVTSVLDARPLYVMRLPGPSFLPMIAAIFLGGLFILPVFSMYTASVISGLLSLATVLTWTWTGTSIAPEKERKDVGHGQVLPIYASGPRSAGWWAMFITMLASVAAFASLLFGYLYYWTIHDIYPPPGMPRPGLVWPVVAALGLGLSWFLTWRARAWNEVARIGRARLAWLAAIPLAAGGAAAMAFGPWSDGIDPTSNAYSASLAVVLLWILAHVAGGIVMQGYALARSLAGRLTPAIDGDAWNIALFWHFTAVMAATGIALVTLGPYALGG